MKYIFSFLVFSVLIMNCNEVQKERWFEIKNNNIVLKSQGLASDNIYSFFKKANTFSTTQKKEMIDELLSFNGDKRISKPFVMNYNKNLSQLYHGKSKNTTIEIEALLMINQLYFDNPFYYSPYPIIVNDKGQEIVQIDEEMEKVFNAYELWFKRVKKKGFNKAKKDKEIPLIDTSYKWIYGVNINPDSPLQFEINDNHHPN